MTSSTYKGNLTVGGSALDKSKLQLRRPTPDSDALASSDDDREHVPVVVRPAGGYPGGRRPSSGWLQDIQPNRKFSLPSVSFAGSQPTTPSLELPSQSRPGTSAFPWNTSSFSNTQANSRLKEVVPSPTSAHFPSERSLPSPAAPEGEEGIGFLLSQQNPIRKAVRSQSYSIGQGDIENSPVGQFSARVRTTAGVRHRPSKPSLLGDPGVGLSQLREDDIDEVDSTNSSDHGVRLPQGYWEREQKQALLKQAAMESARARNRATSTSSPVHQHPPPPQRRKTTAGLRGMSYGSTADYAIEEHEDHEVAPHTLPPSSLTRRFSEHVSILSREPEQEIMDSPKKQQWATGNIHNLNMEAMGRRHSFAHYGGFNQSMPLSTTLSNTQEEDESLMSPRQASHSPEEAEQFDAAAYFAGYGPASRAINASAISAAHPDPIVPNTAMNTTNPYAVPPVLGRPGRRLFVVTFKCSRADIYYLYDNTGLEIRRGDLVMVEGDRGCDLGQVAHADVSLEDAKKYKAEANEEHFRWLVMFSQYSLAGTQNDSGMLGALARANGLSNNPNQPQLSGMIGNQDQDAKPKMIKRLAQQHEIFALRDKEGSEAKAKRLGAQKAADHKLPMEVLDAEYQADYHKLTYFYYAESYVNFNDLVTDLFKQYKVRIWMSAVNPASVVNPAGLMQIPPPSAIGPGAIITPGNDNSSLPVGPGFGGNNSQRSNEHYGRGRNNAPQVNYDEGHYAFSHQLPAYAPQAAYGMPPWAQGQQYQQQMYGGYGAFAGAYPNVTASGSPMNYGAYYPPGSNYGAASAYNRAYPAANSYTPTGSASYGQQTTSGASNGKAAASNNSNNQSFLAGMQNMSLASK
ncbi:uncharacterized protein M421DRAFT_3868 [Didymella exigua CBS 183.55]|uniref:PSP1 C-terminal domain-containing protein n=1 Tax=Didymella exigua CBS 183.55 TaxID=1150837 RepID=A0A6A5RRP2_9PLEO|nr:uncharacterized protein M421DRAFT_3868 [Didymella exigua CBS 183.55]KAF1930113.1 hypothetical protein M421DRAFT_3868 [Didymella exigua CBS 183.55]